MNSPLQQGEEELDSYLQLKGASDEERLKAREEFGGGFNRMMAIDEWGSVIGNRIPRWLSDVLTPVKYLGTLLGIAIGLLYLVRWLA